MELPILYQKTATGSINYWKVWTAGSTVITEWGQVGTDSPQKQAYDAEPKNVGRANETTPEQQADFEANALWKKKKRLKYYESADEAKGTVNVKPMLAQPYDKRKKDLVFPVTVQPKLDGVRCFGLSGVPAARLMSRGGKDYDIAHLSSELSPFLLTASGRHLILDGEVYIHGRSLQYITRLVKKPRPESIELQYHVYDCTYGEEEPWASRAHILAGMLKIAGWPPAHIKPVPTYAVQSHEEIQHLHDTFVADGYEGAIVRTMDHVYRFGYRSPGLLKVKAFEEKEFQIVGWTKGKDDVPLWICRQEDGIDFEVRPKGTNEQRAEMLKTADAQMNKWLTVRFIGRTESNIPKFGAGIVIREPEEFA
jgi:DNA ligase-1